MNGLYLVQTGLQFTALTPRDKSCPFVLVSSAQYRHVKISECFQRSRVFVILQLY